VAKQNYRQMKKQKETARKARQTEKQQKRQTKVDDEPGSAQVDGSQEPTNPVEGVPQSPAAGE
jgi:hypothetical protein